MALPGITKKKTGPLNYVCFQETANSTKASCLIEPDVYHSHGGLYFPDHWSKVFRLMESGDEQQIADMQVRSR